MSRNERVIEAPPEEVFRTLVKPLNFARWVIGSKIVRSVDDGWPKAGSAFHHAIGIGPIHVEDDTRVLEIDEPRRLVMQAGAGPLGSFIVRVVLEPDQHGTRVVMEEEAESGPATALPDFLVDFLTGIRNLGALRRLDRMVEQETEVPGPPSPLATNIIRATARRSRVALAAALGALAVVLLRRRRRR